MSRSTYDAAHIDCPVAGKTVAFTMHDGRLMICPECHKLVEVHCITGAEFDRLYKPGNVERSK